jgi:DtxR family Mn-dependent transcriptional regulator
METWKRFNEKEVSHSMAHYLQAVASLKREKGFARVGDIAERLGVSRSGVTSMLHSLQSRGLVNHERYACVELTSAGRRLAERTESNRQILTVFLRDILGVSGGTAEEDACMIEHLVSAEAMARLLSFTRLMRSDEKSARELRRTFRSYVPSCGDDDDSCEICGDTEDCLRESYETDAAGGEDAA